MNWEKFRLTDGSLDLLAAWEEEHAIEITRAPGAAVSFLNLIQNYQPIKSRQVAALALAQADYVLLLLSR